MSGFMEIIIPARDPGARLLETVGSLAAQTDRDFAVVLSDNGSTKGHEFIAQAETILRDAGIQMRLVRPPLDLGRVEHWNWAHSQAAADWMKPLFVGDLLAPSYVARVRERVLSRPAARFVRCELETRSPAGCTVTRAPFDQMSLTPAEFLSYYPAHGNWIGGPVNMTYHRLAWQLAGGYQPQLPACGDLQLYLTMILRHGLESIAEPLAIFQLHEQRFSHGITRRRVNGCFELWLILRQARNDCLNQKLPWPASGVAGGVWRQLRTDYWYPFKASIKRRLGRA